MSKKKLARPLVFFAIICAIVSFYYLEGGDYLTLEFMQANLQKLRHLHEEHPARVTGGFISIYLFLTSLSIPGSIVLTLLAGALFGMGMGLFWVIFCTTMGACLSFLMSLYLFREHFERKYAQQFQRMNERVKKEGISYLFVLRMIPVSPYVVINVVMGLTNMKLWNFAWVTCLGMLPGTFLYVLAGRKIGSITNISEILSWEIVVALSFLGILPPLIKWALKNINRRERRYAHE